LLTTGSGFVVWVLSARDSDADGWMNLLLPVLVAVFWAVGGLVNATKQKKKQKAAMGDTRKAPATSSEPPMVSAEPAKFADVGPRQAGKGPTGRKGAKKPKPPKRRPPVVPQRVGPRTTPAMDMPLEELPQAAPAVFRSGATERPAVKPQAADSLHLEDLAASYSDPETLRLAILHREILGKPVGLRDDEEGAS